MQRLNRFGIAAVLLGAVAAVEPVHAAMIDYYALNEGSGTTAIDSLNGRNGTISGNVTYTSNGQNGTTAALFGGTNGAISLPGSVLNAVNGSQEVSLTMWVNMSAYNGFETIFDTPSRQFSLWATPSGGWGGTDGFGGPIPFATPLAVNQWQFLAVSYAADHQRFDVFVNGVFEGSRTPATGIKTFNQVISLGFNTSGGGTPFQGMMQEVSIYDTAYVPPNAAPEPAPMALAGAGLLALAAGGFRRKRRG